MEKLTRSDLIRLTFGAVLLGALLVLLIKSRSKDDLLGVVISLLVLMISTAWGGLIANRLLKSEERREMGDALTRILSDPNSELYFKTIFAGDSGMRRTGVARTVHGPKEIEVPGPIENVDQRTDILLLGFDAGNIIRDETVQARIRSPRHNLRVLLLNPDSPLTEVRGRSIDYANYQNRIRGSLDSVRHYFKRFTPESNIEVRLYEDIPSILSVSTERSVWFGPLWNHGNIRDLPVCEVLRTEKNLLCEALDMNFENMWRRATPYPL